MKSLKTTMARLEGSPFRVEDCSWETIMSNDPHALKKGVAYRVTREVGFGDSGLRYGWLLPYRGTILGEFSYNTAKVGIWHKKIGHDRYKTIIIRPRTPKEAAEYKIGNEKDLVAATLNNEYMPDQFADNSLNLADIGTDIYRPPMHTDDDPLNMLMKIGIRLKAAPFDPYGKRLEALAVDKTKGVEGANIRNNTRRAIRLNKAMSPAKFMQYADVWQFEPAFILRDRPGSMHPMGIPDGKMLIIYPSGIPFDIDPDNLIDISDIVADAIAETSSDDYNLSKKTKDTEDDDEE